MSAEIVLFNINIACSLMYNYIFWLNLLPSFFGCLKMLGSSLKMITWMHENSEKVDRSSKVGNDKEKVKAN